MGAAAARRMTRHRSRLGEHFEAQGARHGNGLDKTHLDLIAEAETAPTTVADERVRLLDMAPEFAAAERGGRDEAVGARILEAHE